MVCSNCPEEDPRNLDERVGLFSTLENHRNGSPDGPLTSSNLSLLSTSLHRVRRSIYRPRRAVIKLSILRVDDVLPDLRLRSMHNPEKKDSAISAIAEEAILGFSASIFIARRCCNNARFSVTTP